MGFILTKASKIICPHGGVMQHYPQKPPTIYIEGSPICVMNDSFPIEGCPIGKYYCTRVEWYSGSTILMYDNRPVLLHTSQGICFDSGLGAKTPPIILSYQTSYTDYQMAEDLKRSK